MTRINVVEPHMLTNKHAMAEYKEITRPFNKAMKHAIAGKLPTDIKIPNSYCMGTGHESFFFDKLLYIQLRHQQLFNHLLALGYDVERTKCDAIQKEMNIARHSYPAWFNMWHSEQQDRYLNMARLIIRSEYTTDKVEVVRAITEAEINFKDYL